jgi:hypothetical protein
VFEESGELSAVVELRRHFPGIKDNTAARLCVRAISRCLPAPEANPDMRDQIIDAVLARAIHAGAVRSHPLGPCPTVVAPAAKLAFGRFWSEFRVWKGLALTKGVLTPEEIANEIYEGLPVERARRVIAFARKHSALRPA